MRLVFISVIESFLACGWTIAYHVIKWWTSYPRKPWIVDFGSRFFYWLRWRHPWIVGGTIHGWWAQVPARIKWHRARYARWWVTSSWRALEPVTSLDVTITTSQWSQYTARAVRTWLFLVRTWLLSLPILILRVSKSHNSMVKVLSFFVLNPLF